MNAQTKTLHQKLHHVLSDLYDYCVVVENDQIRFDAVTYEAIHGEIGEITQARVWSAIETWARKNGYTSWDFETASVIGLYK